MTQRARLALAAAVVALLGGALLLGFTKSAPSKLPERPPAERPDLMLLTTLPIVFPEKLTLDAPASPAFEALQSRYRVVPISVAAAAELGNRRLLLMAQPQAQPAEALVELDAWVERGGRLVLLADPALEWPSERALTDRLRPPAAFADTGLLGHWGLRLEPPKKTGLVERELSGRKVLAWSPGRLSGRCRIARDGFYAQCLIGLGRVMIVADADFLNVGQLDGAANRNLDALLFELASIESS